MDANGPPSHLGGTPLGPPSNQSGGMDELSEKQLTPEVLQILMTFLRKNGLSVSFHDKWTEALLSEFDSLIQFVDSSFDFFQAEFSLMLYPVFAHSYIKLLMENSVNNAREFFKRYCKRIPTPYEELVYKLERIQSAHQAQADTYVQLLMKNTFLVKMSKSSIKQLEIPLARTPTIKNIKVICLIGSFGFISFLNLLRSSVESQMGGILGQVSKNEKRHKMYYGVLKDDVSQTIEKKKMRGKELKDNKKSQALAPVPDRIPLPPLSEALREERRKAMRDAAKLTLVSQESPPSVCMLTALNSYGLVSSCDISDDSSILCIGLILMRITSPICCMMKLCCFYNLFCHVIYFLFDLQGHSGAVYSVHFSPDNRLLVSSSLDCSIRLWSLETQKNVVVYRLSRPVWQVQFSNRGYYMCSGGEDNTAMLWCTERMYPLRIFPDCYGSVNCVDFHPNCNYVVGGSCDRYVRVWDVLTGTCVRTFCGHSASVTAVKVSPCGRYIVSTGADGAVCVWDVAYQRLAGMETRDFKGSMGSICFSRDGGSFAVSQGGESLSVYSLDNMIAATSSASGNNELCFDPKINMPNFNIFTYPTMQTSVIGLHFTRRNLLLAVGAYHS
ncbi:unnamed protein product [Haemonchus placei]|uniref:WD_REPEATS_REGION domain-containing protein n=1 Tax=Haemonchus placei TaxID=6290 RepID=A0A0N4WG18_HAEPC|nr:unnamed protein product [Haemonchus placei]